MTHKSKLVVIGNGMAGARLVEEVLARQGGDRFDFVMFGDEPYGNYNRILLSSVLNGEQDAASKSSARCTPSATTARPAPASRRDNAGSRPTPSKSAPPA